MRNIVDFQARQAATSGTSCYPGDEQEVSVQDDINRSEMKGIFFPAQFTLPSMCVSSLSHKQMFVRK